MSALMQLIAADIKANRACVGVGAAGLETGRGQRLQYLFSVRGLSTLLVRAAQAGYSAGGLWRLVALGIKQLNHVITGVDVSPDVTIGPGLRIFHTSGVVIGPGVRIGSNCTIQSDVVVGGTGGPIRGANGAPTIGHDVHLGTGSKIIGDLTIADGVTIGANAVVLESIVEPLVLAAGIPARVIAR